MKPCHENNGAAIYAGRAATAHNGFILMITVENLNRNVAIDQLL